MLTTVEKVIFLRELDIFEYTNTEDLAHIASITEDVTYPPETVIYREGEPPRAFYLVLEGEVQLESDGDVITVARHKDNFGVWALFDNSPNVATAKTLTEARVLRINKEDFIDLLPDYVNITQSLFKALVGKIRTLMYQT